MRNTYSSIVFDDDLSNTFIVLSPIESDQYLTQRSCTLILNGSCQGKSCTHLSLTDAGSNIANDSIGSLTGRTMTIGAIVIENSQHSLHKACRLGIADGTLARSHIDGSCHVVNAVTIHFAVIDSAQMERHLLYPSIHHDAVLLVSQASVGIVAQFYDNLLVDIAGTTQRSSSSTITIKFVNLARRNSKLQHRHIVVLQQHQYLSRIIIRSRHREEVGNLQQRYVVLDCSHGECGSLLTCSNGFLLWEAETGIVLALKRHLQGLCGGFGQRHRQLQGLALGHLRLRGFHRQLRQGREVNDACIGLGQHIAAVG